MNLSCLVKNWSCWYENNVERAEDLYIYRKKKSGSENIDDDEELVEFYINIANLIFIFFEKSLVKRFTKDLKNEKGGVL